MTEQALRALVVRSVDYGESDRIVTLLTDRVGRVSVLARGARRSRRRYGGALSLFVVGKVLIRPGRARSSLGTLERFECIENFGPTITSDVATMAHGSYMLEVAREICPADHPEAEIFELLADSLRALSRGASVNLLRAFELRLLECAGIAPTLICCAKCGHDVASGADTGGSVGFSVTQGGIVCKDCGPCEKRLSRESHRTLLALAATEIEQTRNLPTSPVTQRAIRDVTTTLIRHHLGKDLQSLAFIKQLGI